MQWHKQGLIFTPNARYPWMKTHAALPVARHLTGSHYRVYFASRDEHNRSHVGYVEFDLQSPTENQVITDQPALAPGPLGHFDDHGVYPASLVEHENTLYLYYIGWNPGIRPPLFYASIGLAISDDGKTFQKVSSAPILARSHFDPCLVTAPCVLIDNGIWRMWYVSGFRWEEHEGELISYYHIKYAESHNGIDWQRNGLICIDHRPGERNIARPCVVKENGQYKMWYSYNATEGYRIGYAISPDGYYWTRLDEQANIELSVTGWDSEALAYPWVFTHQQHSYMLYNGNRFGRDGFGLAIAG